MKTQKKHTLTVLMAMVPDLGPTAVLCRGIIRDETLFAHLAYANANDAIEMIGRHYAHPEVTIVFQIPKEYPS